MPDSFLHVSNCKALFDVCQKHVGLLLPHLALNVNFKSDMRGQDKRKNNRLQVSGYALLGVIKKIPLHTTSLAGGAYLTGV